MIDFEKRVLERFEVASTQCARPTGRRPNIILGFSGGADSAALLEVITRYSNQLDYGLKLAHVNHGLSEQSNDWQHFCESRASQCRVDCLTHCLNPETALGKNVEDWARNGRYGWFQSLMDEGDLLVTAHHLDDQLETVLFRLCRGAGPTGLGAMREFVEFAGGYLFRPMLGIGREEICQYVETRNLSFIDDPSNRDISFDRNFLRHEIIPRLKSRWADVAQRVSRSAIVQQQLSQNLHQNADQALDSLLDSAGNLPAEPLAAMHSIERFSLIRRWCQRRHLSLPGLRVAQEIEQRFCEDNGTLDVSWGNTRLRRYRETVYLLGVDDTSNPETSVSWNLQDSLEWRDGTIRATFGAHGGVDLRYRESEVTVGFYLRQGERCHPTDRVHSQKLKKLFQEWGVPPWQRSKVPLIKIDGQIAAVVPYCVDRKFAARPHDPSICFSFIR